MVLEATVTLLCSQVGLAPLCMSLSHYIPRVALGPQNQFSGADSG